jgi:hypothetical protein
MARWYKEGHPGSKNLWRHNVSVGMRESARRRKCPKCHRLGALSVIILPGEGVARNCRWCDYTRFTPVPSSTEIGG